MPPTTEPTISKQKETDSMTFREAIEQAISGMQDGIRKDRVRARLLAEHAQSDSIVGSVIKDTRDFLQKFIAGDK